MSTHWVCPPKKKKMSGNDANVLSKTSVVLHITEKAGILLPSQSLVKLHLIFVTRY